MVRRNEKSRSSYFGNLFLVLFAVFGIWIIGLIKFDGVIPGEVEDLETRTQAIVVLTGGSGRLDMGLDLLTKDPKSQLFVSGVYKGNEVRHLLKLSHQRPLALSSRIEIGNAIDTRENAAETAAWIETRHVRSLRLVTAAYHMPRSLLEFRHKIPHVKIVAHPVFPEHVKQDQWWLYPGTAALVIGEYNKFLLAWTRQKIESLLSRWTNLDEPIKWMSGKK